MKVRIQKERGHYYYYICINGERITDYWPYEFRWTAKYAAKRAIRKMEERKKLYILVEEFEYGP